MDVGGDDDGGRYRWILCYPHDMCVKEWILNDNYKRSVAEANILCWPYLTRILTSTIIVTM